MKKNMGKTDKTIRILIALLFVILYLTGMVGGLFGIILIIFSVMLLLTSFISYCPAYPLIGLNTIKKENQ